MRRRDGQRGSAMVMIMLFVSAVALLLAATLRPLLMERASVERDTLRLAADELLAAGVEAARARGAGPDVRIAVVDLIDEPALHGGFTAEAAPHEQGSLLTVGAAVEGPALRCTRSRRVVLTGPRAPAAAHSDGPFTCAPTTR